MKRIYRATFRRARKEFLRRLNAARFQCILARHGSPEGRGCTDCLTQHGVYLTVRFIERLRDRARREQGLNLSW